MPNVRPLNENKYHMSKDRYDELRYRCYQYWEWRKELAYLTDTVKAIQYGVEGKGSPQQGSATEQLVIRRMELEEKIKIVEQTAIETDSENYKWILKGVTQKKKIKELEIEGMPLSRSLYYEKKRLFYANLNKRMY